jgi:hypothetical protein
LELPGRSQKLASGLISVLADAMWTGQFAALVLLLAASHVSAIPSGASSDPGPQFPAPPDPWHV